LFIETGSKHSNSVPGDALRVMATKAADCAVWCAFVWI